MSVPVNKSLTLDGTGVPVDVEGSSNYNANGNYIDETNFYYQVPDGTFLILKSLTAIIASDSIVLSKNYCGTNALTGTNGISIVVKAPNDTTVIDVTLGLKIQRTMDWARFSNINTTQFSPTDSLVHILREIPYPLEIPKLFKICFLLKGNFSALNMQHFVITGTLKNG